jgi:hypothetical protein
MPRDDAAKQRLQPTKARRQASTDTLRMCAPSRLKRRR